MSIGKGCPKCGSVNRSRIHRNCWMRLIPGTRHYVCEDCLCRFLYVCCFLSFPLQLGTVAV